MIDLNISIAFVAGLLSFFAPCVLPLIPAYIGYITGVSVKDLQKKGYASYKKQMVVSSLMYILGFSSIFVLSGIAAAGIGVLLIRYRLLVQQIGGIIILFLGLDLAGYLRIPFLEKTRQFQVPEWTKNLGIMRAFMIGVIFAAAWTPCVGAILGSIYALAATSGSIAQGAMLLFVYSLGISLPFLAVSLTLVSAPKYLKVFSKRIVLITKIAGIVLILLGTLLLTDTYRYVNSWVFDFADLFGWTEYIINNT